ncbi:hypothetical protein KEM54_002238 [Ascosphaera aggregata]|nr:hypothetical protein KEM54_002238 [Ascosphaera aggregata]
MSDSLATYSMQPRLVHATRLPSTASARSCAHSRTSNHTMIDTDPLLMNLSPEATLKALAETPEAGNGEQSQFQSPLSQSIAELSTRERLLGLRAALVAQKLREWHAEVSSWKWPSPREAALGKGFENPYTYSDNASDREKAPLYLGCKLETVANEEERRAGEIKDGLEDLGVEELERHVLGVHLAAIQSGADNDSSDSPAYNRLNDFTAVITATILNGLPILSKLNELLITWDIRFEVLRQLPPLLESLKNATFEIDRALARLEQGLLPEFDDPRFTRRLYEIARARLEDVLLVVGHHFDVVLDALEGSEDCLPSYWIDDMDTLESDFASWSVAAQKKAMENEWHRDHPLDRFPSPIPEETDEASKHEGEIIPQAHTEPPEARHYWTSSEDESLDTTSSLATSPFSFRDSMHSTVVQDPRTEHGLVMAGLTSHKKGESSKEAARIDVTTVTGFENRTPPRQIKHAATPSRQLKDLFGDQKFSADDIEILPEVEEDTSPTRNRQKRRMTLPLSRYIEESIDYDGPLSLPTGTPTPTPAVNGTEDPDPIPRRNDESKSLDVKKGNISLRDAFNAADALNQVIKSPNTSQSVHSPSGCGMELEDPFTEIQHTPLHRQSSISPSPPNSSLIIPKKRSKRVTPSTSPKKDGSDISSRASPSTTSSPSDNPVSQRNDQSPSPPSNRRRRRRPTLADKINTILDGIPVKLDFDAHTQANGRLAPSGNKSKSHSPYAGSPQRASEGHFGCVASHGFEYRWQKQPARGRSNEYGPVTASHVLGRSMRKTSRQTEEAKASQGRKKPDEQTGTAIESGDVPPPDSMFQTLPSANLGDGRPGQEGIEGQEATGKGRSIQWK